MGEKQARVFHDFIEEWRHLNHEGRKNFEQEFRKQLADDPLYECHPYEDLIWDACVEMLDCAGRPTN